MDLLSPLFSRFDLNAEVFFSGNLCSIAEFGNGDGAGILHVLRRGRLRVVRPGLPALELTEPSLLFYRSPCAHRFEVDAEQGADLVCAVIEFGAGSAVPLVRGLPEVIILPVRGVEGIDGMEAALALLFAEAFAQREGRETALHRLAEYFVVLLLRHALEAKLIEGGTLAALADPRLSKALQAMHEQAATAWTLAQLAELAGMSRARFALHFKAVVGTTPLDYLTDWRIALAQTMLRRGKPMKAVAPAVGYTSTVALTRVFTKRVGLSPGEWLLR